MGTGVKRSENLYSRGNIVKFLKYYSTKSKSTGVKKTFLKFYLGKSTKCSSQKLLSVLVTFKTSSIAGTQSKDPEFCCVFLSVCPSF